MDGLCPKSVAGLPLTSSGLSTWQSAVRAAAGLSGQVPFLAFSTAELESPPLPMTEAQ